MNNPQSSTHIKTYLLLKDTILSNNFNIKCTLGQLPQCNAGNVIICYYQQNTCSCMRHGTVDYLIRDTLSKCYYEQQTLTDFTLVIISRRLFVIMKRAYVTISLLISYTCKGVHVLDSSSVSSPLLPIALCIPHYSYLPTVYWHMLSEGLLLYILMHLFRYLPF